MASSASNGHSRPRLQAAPSPRLTPRRTARIRGSPANGATGTETGSGDPSSTMTSSQSASVCARRLPVARPMNASCRYTGITTEACGNMRPCYPAIAPPCRCQHQRETASAFLEPGVGVLQHVRAGQHGEDTIIEGATCRAAACRESANLSICAPASVEVVLSSNSGTLCTRSRASASPTAAHRSPPIWIGPVGLAETHSRFTR
jgi:hypothetical protein